MVSESQQLYFSFFEIDYLWVPIEVIIADFDQNNNNNNKYTIILLIIIIDIIIK